jgi:hypothetical protein
MPYRNEVQPLNLFGDYIAGRQAGLEQQRAQQVNALGSLQVQRAQGLNALAANPSATPEQYVRAGDAQTGAALSDIQQQQQMDKQQALGQLAGIAQKALTIQDPAQRKGFLQQAGQMYGSAFSALGANPQQGLAELQALPDAELQSRLQQVAQFAAPQKPIEVAAGGALAMPDPNNPGKYINAFANPKDTEITPYQQAQLDIERQKLAQGGKANAIQLQNVTGKLRDDYTGVVNKSGWPDQQNFYERMKSIGKDATGASDLALVFSFMKVLDPTSAVREGEYANAQNTAGIPGWVTAQYNKALRGEILSPDQRTKFLNTADKIYSTAYKKQERIRGDFTDKATRAGVDPRDVLVDFGARAPEAGAVPAEAVPTATGPNGQKLYLRNGQWVPQ